MTQEEFDKQFNLLSDDDEAAVFFENVEQSSKEYQEKVKNGIRAFLVLFQMSQNGDVDMDNWECWSAKYLLGLDDKKEEE